MGIDTETRKFKVEFRFTNVGEYRGIIDYKEITAADEQKALSNVQEWLKDIVRSYPRCTETVNKRNELLVYDENGKFCERFDRFKAVEIE